MPDSTPVSDDYGTMSLVQLPEGYHRVWSGRIALGDLYLNSQNFWKRGVITWIRLDFATIVKDGNDYDTAEWFGCLIRETWCEKGEPCYECGCRSPLQGLDLCDICCELIMKGDR